MDISAVIIFDRKDTHYLNECLSFLPKGTEIVLCETEMVDTPRANYVSNIVDEAGYRTIMCHYYYLKGEFSFADARNYANTLATKDWIISLDADDRVQFCEAEFDTIGKLPENCGGVTAIVISVYPFITETAMMEHTTCGQLKIYRNKPEFKYRYHCHEQIGYSIIENGYKIVASDVIIKHIGYLVDIPEYKTCMINKMLRNYLLLKKDMIDYPNEQYIKTKYNESAIYLVDNFIIDNMGGDKV